MTDSHVLFKDASQQGSPMEQHLVSRKTNYSEHKMFLPLRSQATIDTLIHSEQHSFHSNSKMFLFGWLIILFGWLLFEMDGHTLNFLTASYRDSEHLYTTYLSFSWIFLSTCSVLGPVLSVRSEIFTWHSLPRLGDRATVLWEEKGSRL